jgi:general secretion pathway protein L
MPTLILYLPLSDGTGAPEYDFVRSEIGQQIDAQGRSPAGLLPASRGTEVVAVVPARALSWHRTTLPERVLRSLLSGRTEPGRVRSVLAGVLEEHLLDEPERLHFAVFAADAAQAWVCVCERAWLQSALQALEDAGLRVGRIVAECTPTSVGSAMALLSADLEPGQMLLCSAQGVSLLPLLPSTRGLALAQASLDVLAEPAVMALAQQHFGTQVRLQTRGERLLMAAQSPWNLAQMELSASPGGRLQKRLAAGWQQVMQAPQWRPLRWGVLALLLVQLVGLNALAWRQRSLQAQQRASIDAVFQQTFPDVSLVVNAPLQMQRAVDDLARARGVGGDADLGRMLSIVGPLTPVGVSVTAMERTDQQLLLTFKGLDAGNGQTLLAGLEARGLHGQLQNGQLRIAAGGAR